MAGGTFEHGRLAAAVTVALTLGLRGRPCAVVNSDVRVRIEATDRTTYPDVTVVCGQRQASPTDQHAVTNPTVLVEVLSEGTELSDRTEKFAHYKRLPSLLEYVLVNQRMKKIEVYRRDEQGWLLVEAGAGERLTLKSIDVVLDIDDIYFDPLAPAEPEARASEPTKDNEAQ